MIMNFAGATRPKAGARGSHGQPSTSRGIRKARLAAGALAVAAVTAVIGMVGVLQASVASAAALGQVDVSVSVSDVDNSEAGRDSAWNQCTSRYSQTKSVTMMGGYIGGEDPQNPTTAYQVWECRDTP
jgi:hypothetical protein